MAVLQDRNLEADVIYTMCCKSRCSSLFLSQLTKDHFNWPPTKMMYARISTMLSRTGDVPKWSVLCADPTVESSYRDVMSNFSVNEVLFEEGQQAIDVLEDYRKARILNRSCSRVIESLQSNFDTHELIEELAKSIEQTRIGTKQELYHMGNRNNTKKVIKRILDPTIPVQLVKTGFPGYDTKTGGLPKSGLLIMAANTGGGKSTLALNLALNLYKQALSVGIVSLEINQDKYYSRLVSNISRVPLSTINNRVYTDEEISHIEDSYTDHLEYGKRNECTFTVYPPTDDVTVFQALSLLKPLNYNCIVLDYIGLFGGLSGDDQWRKMMEATRYCKRFAELNNCLIVLIAQLSDEDKLKFSKSLPDHCDAFWNWRMTDEVKDAGEVQIRQTKARDSETFEFPLSFDFATMRFWDKTVTNTTNTMKNGTREVLDPVDAVINGLDTGFKLQGEFDS